MTAAALAEPVTPRTPSEDPFRIGYRYVHAVDASGTKTSTKVPLTEEDFLHPQEEDQFMAMDAHSVAVAYLRHAIESATRDRRKVRTFTEHRIDWQVPGVSPHGPDAVVFDEFTADWDPHEGTLPVVDLGIEVVAVFEVTSEATRHVDFGTKFDEYARVGIPYYLVVDVAAPNGQPDLLGFRFVDGEHKLMRRDPKLGCIVPRLGLWFRWENDRLIVADEDGKDIPYSAEMAAALSAATSRAEAEAKRADAENARADAAQQLADAEKARADDLARELAELKARLASSN